MDKSSQIHSMPLIPNPIAGLKEQIAYLQGVIDKAFGSLQTPFGKNALAYRLLIKGFRKNLWSTLFDRHRMVPMILRDDSGAAFIGSAPLEIKCIKPALRTKTLSKELRIIAGHIPQCKRYLVYFEELNVGDVIEFFGYAKLVIPQHPHLCSDYRGMKKVPHLCDAKGMAMQMKKIQ